MSIDTEPRYPDSSDQPVGGEVDLRRELATKRAGLRFEEAETEAAYRRWHARGRWFTPLVVAVVAGILLAAYEVWLVDGKRNGDLSDVHFIASTVATWTVFALGFIVSIFASRRSRRIYAQVRTIEVQEHIIETEKRRSHVLLRSMLPGPVAERLERGTGSVADFHPEVTVIFADLVGFSPLVASIRPVELVDVLNAVFTRFDALARLYEVERIKTVGDAYVAVAGLPETRPDHAVAAAQLALAMRSAVQQFNEARMLGLSVRIGMATGPAVAGVVGTQRFSYDLWGQTMNTAAGLEAQGTSGRIKVSAATYLKVSHLYDLQPCEPVDLKGIGSVEAWHLEGF